MYLQDDYVSVGRLCITRAKMYYKDIYVSLGHLLYVSFGHLFNTRTSMYHHQIQASLLGPLCITSTSIYHDYINVSPLHLCITSTSLYPILHICIASTSVYHRDMYPCLPFIRQHPVSYTATVAGSNSLRSAAPTTLSDCCSSSHWPWRCVVSYTLSISPPTK